jgi:hypothetical protein
MPTSSALLTGHFTAAKNYEEVIALLTTELFEGIIQQPELTELEAQVLNEDWTLKEGWDWIYDREGKPLFFQSYKRKITTEELRESRKRRFSEIGPWHEWMDCCFGPGGDSGAYSTGKLHPIEGGMAQTHRKLYYNTSNVATDLLGWLRPIDLVYSSSRPCLYFNCPEHFRFRPVSACPRPGGPGTQALVQNS